MSLTWRPLQNGGTRRGFPSRISKNNWSRMDSLPIEFAKSATKDLRGIDRQWIPKIVAEIAMLADEPRPDGCKKLVGSEHTYRIRIGDYRVIYEIQDHA